MAKATKGGARVRKAGASKTSAIEVLYRAGQSVWLDYLQRGMLRSGDLQQLIDRGLRGMTSNPTIFEHAIGGSSDYDAALRRYATTAHSDAEVFETIAVEDVRGATDLFRPVYDSSQGTDGFVSIEVSPALARDTDGTIAEARRLWRAVDRPNVMIKVPGTREGWPAIERLLAEGINVNITLLFSLDHYQRVAECYLRALEARLAGGEPVDRLASVASFFVSRVDTEVDRRLNAKGDALRELRGTVAVANAQLAYAWYVQHRKDPRWRPLSAAGARPQRLLWASTSTKDPSYPDLLYVDSLIAPETVNTMPPATLELFEDHGTVRRALSDEAGDAVRVFEHLATAGVSFDEVTRVLEEEGIEKFAKSFESLLAVISTKRRALAEESAFHDTMEPHALGAAVERRQQALDAADVSKRLWARDPTLWKADPATPEIADRLGWLTVGEAMTKEVPSLVGFAGEVRPHLDRVVLCGMGGSSLAPEVLWRTFGAAPGFPALHVLDSTHPRAVASALEGADLGRTLFLVSSKSGTTQESDSFFRHFWELADGQGAQFVAITDPGTPLAELAAARGFRRTFLNPPEIGGRYSALSYFGLVPAALMGADVAGLLQRGRAAAQACGPGVPAGKNPGTWLGAILGEAALAGRNKATFVLSRGLASFGLWVEQLIAESTGKEGKGIVPVAGEPLGTPDVYGADRLFIALTVMGETPPDDEQRLAALAAAGHPVVRLTLADRLDLGREFFRWEYATAVAGSILRINAFDQPNVAESKANTKAVLASGHPLSPVARADDIDTFLAGFRPGDYLALMAYLAPAAEADRRLADLRVRLRDRLRVATTFGYGPRFLHSTGQLHKGGPPVGHFVQIVDHPEPDVPIPGATFTFGALIAAQAEGDLQALRQRGRPVIRVDDLGLLER
jgi:transaldolase/glucose-6-phosphate isomerase